MSRATKEIVVCWLIAAVLVVTIAMLAPGVGTDAARREIVGAIHPRAQSGDAPQSAGSDRETQWIDEQFDAHERQLGEHGLGMHCCPDDQPREVAR